MEDLEPRSIYAGTGGILSGPASDRQFPVKAIMEAASASHSDPESPYAPLTEPVSHQQRPQPSLGCVGVWSGNREAAFKGELPGLATWVYSVPLESSKGGGDVHYLSVCDEGRLSRIALADVSGHGAGVDNVAQSLLGLMHRYIDTWDQSDLMRDLGWAFGQAQEDSQYATAIVLGFHRELGQIAYTNAGHPAPLWFHAGEKRWGVLAEDKAPGAAPSDLPLGLIPGTEYQQTFAILGPGDLLILYTDGMIEAENHAGEQLGAERLLEMAKGLPTDSPEAAGRSLLSKVYKFSGGLRAIDDETLIVLQRVPSLPLQDCGENRQGLAECGLQSRGREDRAEP